MGDSVWCTTLSIRIDDGSSLAVVARVKPTRSRTTPEKLRANGRAAFEMLTALPQVGAGRLASIKSLFDEVLT
jgi:hypothetical protein